MSKIKYQLIALEKFVCTGSDCPANCCRANWNIGLEPELYQQWQAIGDDKERAWLLAAVVRDDGNDKEALRMKLDATGCCEMQTADRLCAIHQKYGQSMLPAICRNYPRTTDSTGIYELSSMFLSCPESAKAILFNEAGPLFRKSAPRQIPLITAEDQLRHALTELLDRIMAEEKYNLATRIYYLADVIVKLAQLSSQKRLDASSFQRLISNSKSELYQIGVSSKSGRLRPSPIAAGSFWRTMARIGIGRKILVDLETTSPLLAELSGDPALRAEQYSAIHSEILRLRHTAKESVSAYDAHFNRYLHASLMYYGFPWNPMFNNYIASFMMALVPFALARLRLWLLADKQGGLQDQDIVEITYQTERAISHGLQVATILDQNPEVLELHRYHTILLQL